MPDAAGFVPAARLRICYEKTDSHRHDGIGAGGLCAINRATGRQPSERGIQRLYQHRTRFARKIEACQSVLNVLKKEKQHQQFADQESVRVLDYQQCLRATQTGNDQAVKADCDKVWQEIRSNNK